MKEYKIILLACFTVGLLFFANSAKGAPNIDRAFSGIDTNGDNLISKSEFLSFKPRFGREQTKSEKESRFEIYDINNDEFISISEFQSAYYDLRAKRQ